MLIDARTLPHKTSLDAQICIVGAGVAGITLALALAARGSDVCVLEGGGLKFSAASQNLYAGETEGLDYDLLTTRTRFLGGSSNCWGGWCHPFSETDFAPRDWVADSGWPFGFEELEAHYPRAAEILQLGPLQDDAAWLTRIAGSDARFFPFDPKVLTNVVSNLSPPTRFGSVYRDQLTAAPNLRVLLHANAVRIDTDETAAEARGVAIRTLVGTSLDIRARRIVLAAGGIENARLLLLSREVASSGLGNRHDLVGRYFMDHPRIRTARLNLKDPAAFSHIYDATFYHTNAAYLVDGTRAGACVSIAPEIQRAEGLLQCHTGLNASYFGEDHAAIEDAKRLYKAFTRVNHAPVDAATVKSVISGLPSVAAAFTGRLTRFRGLVHYYKLESVIEPEPNRENRVTLSHERDAFGLNRVKLEWRVGDLERRSHRRGLQLFKQQIEANDLGTVELDETEWEERWPRGVLSTWHHMGTTRMHVDPRRGVVDTSGRVHGMHNLYVAGSSVFPTGGGSPPTLTIVALALRLADHLALDERARPVEVTTAQPRGA